MLQLISMSRLVENYLLQYIYTDLSQLEFGNKRLKKKLLYLFTCIVL